MMIISSGVTAEDTVILDERPGEGTDGVNTLQDAIEEVNDGGTIIIKQPSVIESPYEGAKIGKVDDILDDGKSMTIKGEGIVTLSSPSGQSSVIEISENDERTIEIENIMFVDSQYAVEVKSGSDVVLRDIAIGSTIDDKPFVLNDNIQGVRDAGGAKIIDEGVYYPDGQSTLQNDIVEAVNGNIQFESIGTEPTGLIYDRVQDALTYNPVTTSNYERTLTVGSPTQELDKSDDDNLQTNFYSLQSAVNSAASGSVIVVHPRDEPYGDIIFDGEGTSGTQDITIHGIDTGGLPIVNSFRGNYPGEYTIRDVQIQNNVVADADNVDIDVSENYWMSSNGPIENDFRVTTGTSAEILTEPYCTDDRCQNSLEFNDLNKCIDIISRDNSGSTVDSSSYGCNTNTDEVSIEIGGFVDMADTSRIQRYDFEKTDFREAYIDVEANTNQRVDISVNVIASDNPVDAEIEIPAHENFASDNIEAQFTTIIERLRNIEKEEEDIDNPRAYITINNNAPFVITLDDISIAEIGEGEGVVQLPDTAGQTPGNISSDEFEGKIRDEDTFVSRYNSNDEDNAAFHDDLIPPTTTSGGETRNPARGTVQYFEELRTNPDRAAVIRPENPLKVGMSVQGISSADAHTLSLTYAVQGHDSPDNFIDTKIVDSQSDEIYTGRTSELEVTSTSENPFSSAADTEGLETKTKEIPLTSSEVDFVNENGELFVVFENMDIDIDTVLLLYSVNVKSTDNFEPIDERREGADGSESVSTNPDERPGEFTVSFDVDGNKNTQYNSYDVEPYTNLSKTVTIENTGDTTIESDFAIVDEYQPPEIRFPNEGEISSELDASQEELIRVEEFKIEGGETRTISLENSWSEIEFGYHNLKFFEIVDEEYRDINREEGFTPQFDVYVFQPATFEIKEINTPENHLTYDNFNTEVEIHNIGDLPGERTIYTRFSHWDSEETVRLGGGNAREGTTSEVNTIRFARDSHELAEEENNFDFTFREYTTAWDVVSHDYNSYSGPFENEHIEFDGTNNHYRPDAPFGLTEGTHEYQVTVFNEFDDTDSTWPRLYDESVMTSEQSKSVTLNDIVINDLNVLTKDGEISQRPTEDDTIYASAYPYVQPSYGINTDALVGESYVEGENVRGGLNTMYSYKETGDRDSSVNRGATPLNLHGIDSVTQPHDRYFSIYYSHQNRYCNDELWGDKESVHVSEDDKDESDTNVFLPFSADGTLDDGMCGDEDRYVSLQMPRFAGTTDDGAETDRAVPHPDGEDFEILGTNQDTFEELEEDENIMYAVATISNPSDSQPATARFEIQSDNAENERGFAVGLGESGDHQNVRFETNNFEDNVVGAAAVELRPHETRDVYVPIIIKNDAGNEGVHVLSIHPRSEEDYIRRSNSPTPKDELPESPLTDDTHSQFEVPINVSTYGDAIIRNLEPTDTHTGTGSDSEDAQNADLVVSNICTSNEDEYIDNRDSLPFLSNTVSPDLVEGLNPKSGNNDNADGTGHGVVRDIGECNTDTRTDTNEAKFEVDYTNYGGSTVSIQPEALAEFETTEIMTDVHIRSGQRTGDLLFANYDNDDSYGLEIEPTYKVDGSEINMTEEIDIEPGESRTFEFSRVFQEPGLYHIRHSPCRKISEYGPQNYQLSGFTGIPDSVDSSGETGYRYTWRGGQDRADMGEYNLVTTAVMANAAFHGAKGCDDHKTSVFVYDTTEPVADFMIAESDSAVKSSDNTTVQTELADQTPNNAIVGGEEYSDKNRDFEVYEGGLLFFDGSTWDCDVCYDSDVFNPDTQADVTDWTNRGNLTENNLKTHRMSQVNTRITDMLWEVNGGEPNYGNDNVCEHVSQNDVDEHCYMEVVTGQNDYEVTAHRFNNPDENEISLQVWDDTEFTEGDANTNRTTHTVNVIQDDENPNVTLDYDSYNDLSYAEDDNLNHAEPIWHRNEEVIEYTTLDNMDDEYGNTYEGIRTCLSATASDNQIGISQDAWYDLDDSTLVIDDGGYYNHNHGGNMDAGEVNFGETRDGDRRCIIFEEEDSNGDKQRTQTFEYEAWDFADNSESKEVDITVNHTQDEPWIDVFGSTNGGHFDHNSDTNYVWAAHSGTGWEGGEVTFDGSAHGFGVGLACIDLRAEPAQDYCNSIADNAFGDFDDTYSAEELGYYSDTIETETLKATDWHSHTVEDTTDVRVRVDTDNPDYWCDPSDCEDVSSDTNNDETDSKKQSASTDTVCVTFVSNGHDDGTAFMDYDIDNGGDDYDVVTDNPDELEVCVDAEAEAHADDADADSADCGEVNTDDDDDYDDEENEVTVTVTDYHNNSSSETIRAYAEAYAEDEDVNDGGECDDDDAWW